MKGKKIILGITGSIAAYKSAFLLRLLIKEGAEVQVVITSAGKEFITPVTLSALSGKPVLGEFFKEKDGTWHSHVDLGLWADLMIIAPASANTIAKMATGICDNLLLTTYLSAKCPVMVAPAMDLDMFSHPSTLANINRLIEHGCSIVEPGTGVLASGLYGKGRMEEPEVIINKIMSFFSLQYQGKLSGKKILLTAGPTYEKIDPARFIGNYSSGKMGYALAEELANRGAEVSLVSGPVTCKTKNENIKVIKVESAVEMLAACSKIFMNMDVAIMAAAVADYTVANPTSSKLKRKSDKLTLELNATADIAATLGQQKKQGQVLAGFALETENGHDNAVLKMKKKNLDFIVLNEIGDEGVGFMVDTNRVTILDNQNKQTNFSLKDKADVAKDIVDYLENYL